MLAGPCASQFRTWLACTKQGAGNDKDDYVTRCKDQFEALHGCLDENDQDGE